MRFGGGNITELLRMDEKEREREREIMKYLNNNDDDGDKKNIC